MGRYGKRTKLRICSELELNSDYPPCHKRHAQNANPNRGEDWVSKQPYKADGFKGSQIEGYWVQHRAEGAALSWLMAELPSSGGRPPGAGNG